MARQLSLPGMVRTPKDLSTERLLQALPEAARPVYLEALHRAAQLCKGDTAPAPTEPASIACGDGWRLGAARSPRAMRHRHRRAAVASLRNRQR
ncbi:MAG: hypothetical protein K0S46_2686 [Moraxellaceae bacterium]|jgi:hypothetical protein|nr:hypothetical protein [Moraxellaceae bacterium]